jgi:hypothetical protein
MRSRCSFSNSIRCGIIFLQFLTSAPAQFLAYLLCAAFNPELRRFWAAVLECGEGGTDVYCYFFYLGPPFLRKPAYGVLGNHDAICMLPGLEAMGIRMLLNEHETVEHNNDCIYLAGIDDAHFYRAMSGQ